ncbi:Trifunctional nucleotide phosphoesterase [Micractinium conductrix]|uniref:Trifunctional nucleotide phosphoesterase n=1 Tax=Micractinium conductrix TaxID=554055 RepID=A0A2P6VR97_9CHLO|nr:Trifunctional nucleotide phosphoesterase [Micractinium conductrix]|eukprot:PSC76623.1 Trifunctional nucleotide phosphoesterase [Micractinium conductrix]
MWSLVRWSRGDCLNPSLMSAFTRGEQMVPVLNSIGVHAAAVGNHDFDFGVERLQQHMHNFRFPWLLSNVLSAQTGQPLGGAHRSLILDWHGVKVGLMGLVEREWLLTIPSVEERDIVFLDFCDEGRRLAAQLAAEGAELIVALTHMRTPNDLVLAGAVPEIQLLLSGHDHHYEITESAPHGTLVFKSGTDFRELSLLHINVPASLAERPRVEWERINVTSAVPEDPEVAAIVQGYLDLMGTKMDEPMGWSHTPLDARFDVVRRQESNLGSLFADICRISLGADAAFFNGGTIRSDQVHAAGQLLMRDFVSMLPFTDELVLLELSGSDILTALETGVGSFPALEGRFLQVSGVTFAFDSDRPAGSRIVPGSVTVGGEPLELERRYKVATKAYLRGGKDGFESLKAANVLVDGETNPRLATLVQYLWMRVEYLNESVAEEWHRMVAAEAAREAAEAEVAQGEAGSNGSSGGSSGNGSSGSEQAQRTAVLAHGEAEASHASSAVSSTSSIDAVYSPGAAISGTATGGPGSIPLAAEQHVLEVTATGAAISLALLLQQRAAGDDASSGSDSEDEDAASDQQRQGGGGGGAWLGDLPNEEARAHSSAALSALAYLEPCAHGLDELIVFDAVRRKFGIAPQVEGRITRAPGGAAGK